MSCKARHDCLRTRSVAGPTCGKMSHSRISGNNTSVMATTRKMPTYLRRTPVALPFYFFFWEVICRFWYIIDPGSIPGRTFFVFFEGLTKRGMAKHLTTTNKVIIGVSIAALIALSAGFAYVAFIKPTRRARAP